MDNQHSEIALLGAAMRDGKAYERAREIVKPAQFEKTVYQWAWLAMEHLYEQGMGIDTVTVGDELERMGKMSDFSDGMWSGRALLSKIREDGDPRNVLSYAENVQDLANKRLLDAFFTKCVMWSKNGRRSSDIMADVTNELSKLEIYGKGDEYTVAIGTAVSEYYDRVDGASIGKIVGIPTGYIDLDAILGTMENQSVYLLAARPGQGKTAMVLSIAKHAAQKLNKRVAIFSLEMSRSQVAGRLIANEAEIDLRKMKMGKMDENEWARFTSATEVIDGLPIVINDLSSIDINQIRQTARKIKADGGLDLLVLDYIQLASAPGGFERRDLEVSEVSRGLKYLARELDIPILSAAQLSRSLESRSDKRPILSDLRESGSLENDAYCVMFIYRPDQYEKESAKQNVAEIIIAKHRDGPVGTCELLFRPQFTKFVDCVSTRIYPND